MREAEDLIRREQLFVYLCICAFVWPRFQKKHRKKTNTQKTPSDGTVRQGSFVYLFICVFNNKITALPSPTRINSSVRPYLQIRYSAENGIGPTDLVNSSSKSRIVHQKFFENYCKNQAQGSSSPRAASVIILLLGKAKYSSFADRNLRVNRWSA